MSDDLNCFSLGWLLFQDSSCADALVALLDDRKQEKKDQDEKIVILKVTVLYLLSILSVYLFLCVFNSLFFNRHG